MRLKDTGLTVQDIKDKVNKYMIETYERFDFLAETAEGMYMYDENGTPESCCCSKRAARRYHAYLQLSIHHPAGTAC